MESKINNKLRHRNTNFENIIHFLRKEVSLGYK
nr:MAG TPA: hypothetical protein [Caudoviricetes sp.]